MKKLTKLSFAYILWAFLLQHHAVAGQKVFAILNGKMNRLWTLSGYLAISLAVISLSVVLCRPLKRSWPGTAIAAFTAWFVAFLAYWSCLVHYGNKLSYENLFALFAYLVLPHIIVPIAPLGVLAFSMKRKAEPKVGQVSSESALPDELST